MPVIVMTGHHRHGLNLTMELMDNGSMDFISKPFGNGTEGKSLSQVIQAVLDKHRKSFPPGTLPSDPPKPFEVGTLAFYADHIELAGEIILDRDNPGHAWDVFQVLRKPRPNGTLPRLNAPQLAKAIDPRDPLSDGAINSCVHTLRARIAAIMLEKANLTVKRDDVVANRGQGYHLADWLVIENHDDGLQSARKRSSGLALTKEADVGKLPKDDPAQPKPLTDRQHWILQQLRQGETMTRKRVEQQFGIKEKQAKRELTGLSTRGMIQFIRKPRPGYYVLRHRPRCQDRS